MSEKFMQAGAAILAALIGVGITTSCRNPNTKQAVQQAIDAHLQENSSINRSNFSTEIEKVDFKGDTAQALVKFQSKQAPSLAVHVRYSLKRLKGRWVVLSSEPAGGQGTDSHIGPEAPRSGPAAPSPDASSPAPVTSH